MGAKLRHGVAAGGADNQTNSSWYDNGGNYRLAGATALTAPVDTSFEIVPFADSAQPDSLPSGTPIQRLFGAYLSPISNLAAQANLSVYLSVMRSGATVGGGPAFGWLGGASGSGTPGMTGYYSYQTPALTSNTALDSSHTWVPVQPGDILVVSQCSTSGASGTIAVPTAVVRTAVR